MSLEGLRAALASAVSRAEAAIDAADRAADGVHTTGAETDGAEGPAGDLSAGGTRGVRPAGSEVGPGAAEVYPRSRWLV
ncbi:hypothetical protein [Rhodococcus triatomae]|nr:hypothetical protein G419_17881 [Rhodococcus triatomae BKS 15-14]